MYYCKKCGAKATKYDLDKNGLCYDCTDDLSFKAKQHIISHEERKKIERENSFYESVENNSANLNPMPIFIFSVICVAIYFYASYSNTPPRTTFWGTFLSLFFYFILAGIISVIIYCFSTEIIKPILIAILKKMYSLKQAVIFLTILTVLLLLICALIVAIKSII